MQLLTAIRGALLIGICCTLTSLYAAEPDALTRISSQIEQYPVIRAEFTQNKQIAAMKRSLVTIGRFTYSRHHGVLWQIEQPYRMGYILGTEKIVEIGADGTHRERSLREVPGLAQVGRVFRAMLGTDTTALREYFNVTVQSDSAKWEIELKPRQPQLAQFLTGLQLSGSQFVNSIRIDETGGDATQIRFRNTQGASALNAAELQLFGDNPSASPESAAKQ